jgi:transposase InsO family protein
MVENQLGKRIKCVRSDNGTEYLCNEFESYLEKHGIKHEMTVAYTPEQNGVAERRNRTLVEMARCMMIQSQVSPSFWAEAISTANYLTNRCPSRSINGQTPHKLWTGKDFSVKHFQIFGTKGYRLDKTPNKGKFDPRSKKCIFVGYSTERRAYRVWCPDSKRIYATRDVKFVNNFEVKEQPMQEEFTSEDIMMKEKEVEIYLNNYRKLENENNENQLEDQTEIENLQENYNERRVETREKRKPGRPKFLNTGKKGRPKKLYVQACEEEITEKEGSRTNEMTEEDPKTIKKAFLRQESQEWREAMKNEFNSLKKIYKQKVCHSILN